MLIQQPPMPIGRPHARGFSLIELLVVLVLVAILAVLATPSMNEWMKNQRIRGTAESLLNGLQTAREEAIRRNRPVSFWLVSDLSGDCTLSDTSSAWVVSLNSPAGDCDAEPSATTSPMLVNFQAAQTGVDVSALDADDAAAYEARFDSYGRITASTSAKRIAHIDVYDPADASKTDPSTHTYRSLRVVIQGSGAIRLCDPRITTAGDTRQC